MKKILLALVALFVSLALFAGEPLYKFSSYRSSDQYEHGGYSYNDQNQLICVETIEWGEYEVRDSLSYNDRGDLIRIDGWQLFGSNYRNVYYVEFTYDENHNQLSRTNYNNVSGSWELGGVYNYTYENGNRTLSLLTMAGSIWQRIEYTYDNNNNLKEEVWYSKSFFDDDTLDPSNRYVYAYNENGSLRCVTGYIWNNSDWDYDGKTEYDYDGNGNCTEYRDFDDFDRISVRKVFHFDERLMADVLRYPDSEQARPVDFTWKNHNIAYLENYYALDVEGDLQYICDYIYTYIDINETALPETRANSLNLYPNPATDMIYFNVDSSIEIFDMQGHLVLTADGGHANVQSLTPGSYIVRSSDGSTKFIKR